MGQRFRQTLAAAWQVDCAERVVSDQIFPKQESKKRFQRGYTPGIGSMTGQLLQSALFEKSMNCCHIDTIQGSFPTRGEKAEKKIDIGSVRLDTVLRQSSFRDEVVKIEFVCCGKLWSGLSRFNSASAVRQSGMGCCVTHTN